MTLTKRTVIRHKSMNRSNALQHENDSESDPQNDQAIDRTNGHEHDALNENDHVHAKIVDGQMGNSLQLFSTQQEPLIRSFR